MSKPNVESTTRVPELDGIRGVAIGMVLIAHFFLIVTRPGSLLAYALVPFRLTWSGVDLFFVLSGFLIGGILLDAREASNYFRIFYIRRFFRILPIYFVLLVAVAIATHLWGVGLIRNHQEIFSGRLAWAYYPLFLQNIGMSVHNSWSSFPLGVTWSLAIEEQFYLTLPLLIHFLSRRALLRFTLFTIAAAPLLRVFFYYRNPDNFFTWFTLMPCRADALLLGVLGAMVLREPRWRAWLMDRRRLALQVIGILLLGVAFLGWRSSSQHEKLMGTIGFSWLAITYLAFLLYALLYPAGWLGHCLRRSWLRGLGIIAYGTYIFHEFFLGLIFGRIPFLYSVRDVGLSLLVLGITLGFCQLSWVYFEKPLVRIGHRSGYLDVRKFAATAPAIEAEGN